MEQYESPPAGSAAVAHPRPVLVISRCLECEPVRYDGSLIHSPHVALLRQMAECIFVCPEVEIGLGIPRAAVRLVRVNGEDRLIQPATGRDLTGEMEEFASRFLASLPEVDGFVFKSRSPTSGLGGVKIYPKPEKSAAIATGRGFFARRVLERYPLHPAEDEQRLNNRRIREHFFTSIYALARLRTIGATCSRHELIRFHTEHKLLLMAYNQRLMREMGRLVAEQSRHECSALMQRYRELMLQSLARPPRYTSVINVLLHALGHFSLHLSREEKELFLRIVERYRRGSATLAEPRAVLRAWAVRHRVSVIADQAFLSPYPEELQEIPEEETDRGRDMWAHGRESGE
ncbi:MAG: DUF523 and DUF1722 domain-containing protein [Methanomicrobiales archaeon]|nr:DUF523 and DUF1722 domain-containing protein [Methanomicrobiales archaeon]